MRGLTKSARRLLAACNTQLCLSVKPEVFKNGCDRSLACLPRQAGGESRPSDQAQAASPGLSMIPRNCSTSASFRAATSLLYELTLGSMNCLSRTGSEYISYKSTTDFLFSRTKHTSSIGF